MFSNVFSEYRAVYEIMWTNIVNFYVLLTAHPNIMILFYQSDAQILYFNTFI